MSFAFDEDHSYEPVETNTDISKVSVCNKPSTTDNRSTRRAARRRELQTANSITSDGGTVNREQNRRMTKMSDKARHTNSYIKHSTVPLLRNRCILVNMNRPKLTK
jgi:hypothetical protein